LEAECEIVLDSTPLRQGDVFQWIDHHNRRPWMNMGIVITADCDIAQKKTYGRLSYIPVISMEDYLWHFWRPAKFEQIFNDYRMKATKRINTYLQKVDPARKGVTEDAATAWIQRSGAEGLPQEIGIKDKGQVKDLQKIIEEFIKIHSLMNTEEPDMSLLKGCYCLKNKKAEAHSEPKELALEVQSTIASLPGDIFFLSCVPNCADQGVFAMLRYISQCPVEDIGLTPEEVRFGSAKAKRVARISAPYKYALTQNLAKVFSDIGLPDKYKARLKVCSHKFFGLSEGEL
jgi:hypothetical protein